MIEIIVFCAVMILLSLFGLVWDIWSGLIASGVDGLLLLFICLSMGGLFTLMLLYSLWKEGWLGAKSPRRSDGREDRN